MVDVWMDYKPIYTCGGGSCMSWVHFYDLRVTSGTAFSDD